MDNNLHETTTTRDMLKEFIEKGIDSAIGLLGLTDGLTEEEIGKLRKVGEEIPYVAFGRWKVSNNYTCGCPATEAGLARDDEGEIRHISLRVREFASGFDKAVTSHLVEKGEFNSVSKSKPGVLIIK